MDYEKKYNEALKRAEDFKNGIVHYELNQGENIVNWIFPELRESEDERIRNEILIYIGARQDIDLETHNRWCAYLEKQKEQKPAEWSEKDKGILLSIKCVIDSVWHNFDYDCSKEELKEMWNWLDTLWQRVEYPQPMQEWSEGDEDMLNSCISSIEEAKENRYAYKETDGDTSYDHEIDWLKSLRPSWKPSEEQMETLLGAKGVLRNLQYNDWAKILASLYEQLKKL